MINNIVKNEINELNNPAIKTGDLVNLVNLLCLHQYHLRADNKVGFVRYPMKKVI